MRSPVCDPARGSSGRALSALLGLALCGCVEYPLRPQTVVDRAIVAMGGEERLARLRGVTWRSRGEFLEATDRIPYQAEWSFALPLLFRWEVRSGGRTMIEAFDGERAWADYGDGPIWLEGDAARAVFEMAVDNRSSLLLPLRSPDVRLASGGETDVAGRPAQALDVSFGGGIVTRRLAFDSETYLLVQTSGPATTPSEGVKHLKVRLWDYRLVDGVRYPHRSEVWLDGRKVVQEDTIVDLRLEPRPEEFYRRPAGVEE